jgi:hypothetical protein
VSAGIGICGQQAVGKPQHPKVGTRGHKGKLSDPAPNFVLDLDLDLVSPLELDFLEMSVLELELFSTFTVDFDLFPSEVCEPLLDLDLDEDLDLPSFPWDSVDMSGQHMLGNGEQPYIGIGGIMSGQNGGSGSFSLDFDLDFERLNRVRERPCRDLVGRSFCVELELCNWSVDGVAEGGNEDPGPGPGPTWA